MSRMRHNKNVVTQVSVFTEERKKMKNIYDESGNVLFENVTPVRYCNDGYYHTSENTKENYYVTEDDNYFVDENGKKIWEVALVDDVDYIAYELVKRI